MTTPNIPPTQEDGETMLTNDRNDPDLHIKEPSGMNKKYLVLSDEERQKRFCAPSSANLCA
jgi:hypothetical protein